MTAPRVLALSLLFALMAPLGACSDDEAEAPAALEGEKAGHVRYIVYLKGDPPDLTAYKAARAAGEPTEASFAILAYGDDNQIDGSLTEFRFASLN